MLAALSVGLFFLAANLRPDAFYAGDPGVKLIAAQNALDHPSHPFDIALPTIGGTPVPHVEPFFSVHGQHAHAVTSPIFPVLTAPFLSAFGVRGLYLLPALGFLAVVLGSSVLGKELDRTRQPIVVAITAAIATPFLFYGLEFWEHTLALACAVGATIMFLRARALTCGLLFGVAALLRPEAVWYAVSVFAASTLLPARPSFRTLIIALGGAVLVVLPFELYTFVHLGTILPPHLNANAGLIGDGWLHERGAFASLWLGTSVASFWRVAPVVAIALVSPLVSGRRSGRAFLWMVAVVNLGLVLLTAPNDGGGQWAPRYLLLAYLPLIVLAADAIETLRTRTVASTMVIVVLVIGCLWIQRSAYRQLRGTKATYGRIVDWVATVAPASSYVVTDVWWLDQIAAADVHARHWLFAPETATARALVQRLSDLTQPTLTVIRSATESPDTGSWSDGTCYFEEERERTSTRDLVAIRLRHRCGH